jgi:hypothetical protein
MTTPQADLGADAPVGQSVAAAEASVARAGVAFSASLQEASLVGRETGGRVVAVVRPLLIGVGVLAAAAIAVQLLRGPGRERRQVARTARSDPFWSELARKGATLVMTVVARRFAERWLGASAKRA